MNDRADGRVCEEIDDTILAGFQVHFDFGKRGDIGMGNTVARVTVLGYREQTLPGKRCCRSYGEFIDFLGQFVAVVDPSELYRPLCRLRQSHSRAAAFAENAVVSDIVIFGVSAKGFGWDL